MLAFSELEYSGNLFSIQNQRIKSAMNYYYNNNMVKIWNPLLEERNWKVNDIIQTRLDDMYSDMISIDALRGGNF